MKKRAERIAMTNKGIDSYHKLFDWFKETLDGVKIKAGSC